MIRFLSLKKLLPRTFFGRALLMVVLPTILAQAVASYVFYERHWRTVHKYMAAALTNEIAYVVHRSENPGTRLASLTMASKFFELEAEWQKKRKLQDDAIAPKRYPELINQLSSRLEQQFYVSMPDEDIIEVDVEMQDGILSIRAPEKRIASATTYIFLLLANGAALLLLFIAILFLRNQVKPIQLLAAAAEAFGKGQEILQFRPRGALEVRRAGQAFLVMSERLKRLITRRTQMLAAISHDLRTPLTRMKLQLAMLDENNKTIGELKEDIQEMENMIREYLDFARGEGGEQAKPTEVNALLEDIVSDYGRSGKNIEFSSSTNITMLLREQSMRRCINNIIDNALRFGSRVAVSHQIIDDNLYIIIDDNGPGIPADKREQAMQPFRKLDEARTPGIGGVGLGLTIAKDIVLGHGGTLMLEESPIGGLRVSIILPV